MLYLCVFFFFFSSRRRHTRCGRDWSSDVCSSDLQDHPEIDKKLFWFNSVSDEFLDRLYSSAYCLISASEGEGFGLPIIERSEERRVGKECRSRWSRYH